MLPPDVVAYNSKDFHRKFGYWPKGHWPLEDFPLPKDEHGEHKSFKGVLMLDVDQPTMRYQRCNALVAKCEEVKMNPESTVRPKQAEDVYNSSVKTYAGARFGTRLRNVNRLVSDIQQYALDHHGVHTTGDGNEGEGMFGRIII